MTFDLAAILASKQRYRAALAARPIEEKLRLLDTLRERTLTLRQAAAAARERGDGHARPAPRGGVDNTVRGPPAKGCRSSM
jgi:hypothetical protein